MHGYGLDVIKFPQIHFLYYIRSTAISLYHQKYMFNNYNIFSKSQDRGEKNTVHQYSNI